MTRKELQKQLTLVIDSLNSAKDKLEISKPMNRKAQKLS
jgi:hypothetical protein